MRWRTPLLGVVASLLLLAGTGRAQAGYWWSPGYAGPYGYGYAPGYGYGYAPWYWMAYGQYVTPYPYAFYTPPPWTCDQPVSYLTAEYQVHQGGYEAVSYIRILGAQASLVSGPAPASAPPSK